MQLTRVLSVAAVTALGACSEPSSFSTSSSGPAPFPTPNPSPPADPDMGDELVPCPSDAPSDDATCGVASAFATCRYGADVRDECNDAFTCEGQRWRRTTPATTCEPTCPGIFDDIPIGAACADNRVACSYDEGTCGCVGERDAEAEADAGGAPTPGVWKCVPPPPEPGCPSTRPQRLDPCVKEVRCDYGTCELGRPLLWYCSSNRQWSGPATRKCDP